MAFDHGRKTPNRTTIVEIIKLNILIDDYDSFLFENKAQKRLTLNYTSYFQSGIQYSADIFNSD